MQKQKVAKTFKWLRYARIYFFCFMDTSPKGLNNDGVFLSFWIASFVSLTRNDDSRWIALIWANAKSRNDSRANLKLHHISKSESIWIFDFIARA